MKKKLFLIILTIVVLIIPTLYLINDSGPSFPDGDGHTKDMKPLKSNIYDLNYLERDKIGISRTYSPDKQKYFIYDPYGNFTSIYLSIDSGKLEKIYDYPIDDILSRELVIDIYWGGKSDKLYMHFPFFATMHEYSISEKKWTEIEVNDFDGRIIAPIYNSDNFLVKDKLEYKSYNVKNGQMRSLDIPVDFVYCDQKEDEIIFCDLQIKQPVLVLGREVETQKIKLYNTKTKIFTEIKLPTDAFFPSQIGYSTIKFIPNTSTQISYTEDSKAEEGYTDMTLVLFDYESMNYKTYPLGINGYQDWISDGSAIYGSDYILYFKKNKL